MQYEHSDPNRADAGQLLSPTGAPQPVKVPVDAVSAAVQLGLA